MEETMEGAGAGGSQHIVVVIAVAVVSLTAIYFALSRSNGKPRKRLPPGPRGWPVVGSLLSLGTNPHEALALMAKKYGPLLFLRLGSSNTVVVSNWKIGKELFKTLDEVMAARPPSIISDHMTYGKKDIAFAEYGTGWRERRKICTQELLTSARLNKFQGSRTREIMEMLHSTYEESQKGNAIDMSAMSLSLSTNIVTQMMWNKSFSKLAAKETAHSVTAEAAAFQEVHGDIMEMAGDPNMADFIPMLRPLLLFSGLNKRMKSIHSRMDNFLENVIAQSLKKVGGSTTGGNETSGHDFAEVLLQRVKTDGPITIESTKAIFTDMLVAGPEPMSIGLKWALAEMVRNPSLIKKAQEELDSVVGRDRLVTESDIPNLKYLQTVIKETFRLHPPLPIELRYSRFDCEWAGYHIPANTGVFINVWVMHRDPEVWENPLVFNPDRFAGSTMDVKGTDYELLPFGSGRRICPGMGLVLCFLHYTLAQLLHTFTWGLPGDQKVEDMNMSETFSTSFGPSGFPLTLMAEPRLAGHVISPITSK